jgi:hypothetical protein
MSRGSSFGLAGVIAASLWLACLLAAPALRAQSAKDDADALFASRFEIDDADPSSKIPSLAERDATPVDFAYFVMNLSERAEAAEKRGDRAAQIRYLRAIAASVPDRSVGFSRLCGAYEAARQLPEAEQSCGAAISLPGASHEDFARYVRVVLGQERELNAAQLENLKRVQAHLHREAPQSPALLDLDCQLAIRLEDAGRYAACLTRLSRLQANDVKRLTYEFAWSIGQHDYAAATRLIEQAKTAPASSEVVDQMTRARTAALPWWRRTLENPTRIASMAALALAVLAAAFVQLRKRRTLSGSAR